MNTACRASSFYRWRKVFVVFLLALFSLSASAQLCTGSLGDPVVNITFGNASAAARPLDPGVTSYTYVLTDCPQDGTYTVRNTTANCFGSWHTVASDHTGDGQGNFMLVNASYEPGDFYVQTITGLCANTTYEFAAWVMNVLRASNQIKPDITFTIEKRDGTLLGMFSTGGIDVSSQPQWKQYGLNFKTPPGTFEVVLRMRNNAPGGIGNDIALDDITFRPCGATLNSALNGSTNAVDVCEGSGASFTLTSTGSPFFEQPLYQWQQSTDSGRHWTDMPQKTGLSAVVNPGLKGAYWYRLTAAEAQNISMLSCRIGSNTNKIMVHEKPVVSAGADKVVIKGDAVQLDGIVADSRTTVVWSPASLVSDSKAINPTTSPESDTRFLLTATSAFGCIATDETEVKVISGIYIPTSFTPNGDGLNDVWKVENLQSVAGSEVWVFNRGGELVYHEQNKPARWDGKLNGKPVPSGVFVYLVKLQKGVPFLKGFITLVR